MEEAFWAFKMYLAAATKSLAVTGATTSSLPSTHTASCRRVKVQVRPSSEFSQAVAREGCMRPYISYSTRVSIRLAAMANSLVVEVIR